MITRKVASGRTRRNAVAQDVIDTTVRRLTDGESFASLGIQQICDAAGVARSAFYKNFTDKADLLRRMVAEATADFFETARAWVEGTGDEAEMVTAHLNTVRVWRAHAPLFRAYFAAAASEPDLATVWDERMRVIIDSMAQRIEAGKRDGAVAVDLDTTTVAEFIVYGFERLTAQHIATQPEGRDAAFAKAISHVGWRLIYGTAGQHEDDA